MPDLEWVPPDGSRSDDESADAQQGPVVDDVTYTLERAVLGAVLARPDLWAPLVTFLRPDQVSDLHRPLFEAIDVAHRAFHAARRARPAPGAAQPDLDQVYLRTLAQRLDAIGVTPEAEENLRRPANCPNPDNGLSYGRMLVEHRVRLGTADHATRLVTAARAAATGTGTVSAALHHLDELSAALVKVSSQWGGVAGRLNLLTQIGDPPPEERQPPRLVRTDPFSAQREDLVLAGLLQHPQQIAAVRGWLTPDAFTVPGRAEVYQTLLALHDRRLPVDPITVAWEARWRAGDIPPPAPVDTSGTAEEPAPRYERPLTPTEIAKLRVVPVALGTAVELGRDVVRAAVLGSIEQHAHHIGELTAGRGDPKAVFGDVSHAYRQLAAARAALGGAGLDPTAATAPARTRRFPLLRRPHRSVPPPQIRRPAPQPPGPARMS